MTLAFKLPRLPDRQGRNTMRFWALLAAASLGVGMVAGVAANAVRAAVAPSVNVADVRAALKARLPKTKIGAIDCSAVGDLCEVVAGTTLFYVDRTARYLMIGRVYDMETRSDVTAARLLALNPDLLVAGAARNEGVEEDRGEPASERAAKVDLAKLPRGGAIRWGPANGPKLVVLSDFACGYCRKLTVELAKIGARVEERPISIFGHVSRTLAERVLCAKDPVAALHAAYAGKELPEPGKCDTSGLDANEAFAKAQGFGGTPVIIRADGAVFQGYRPAAALKAFAEGGAK